MGKMIGFRPSEKADEAIRLLVKQKKAKSKSDAVNQLIELAIQLEQGVSTQPPQPLQKLKDVTGVIIQCPMRPLPVPFSHPTIKPFVLWKTPVDSSVCKSCSKYPCESWEIIQSEDRVGIERSYHQTLREHGQL